MFTIRKAKTLATVMIQTLRGQPRFECSVCGWTGVFFNFRGRIFAECAKCGALERHRHQALVHTSIFDPAATANKSMLHFAPERFFTEKFRRMFGTYETADINRSDVTHRCDLRSLPFKDGSYDVVYASHVLEHIDDDASAISEIHRILKPGGIAILPVPIKGEFTVEFSEPDPRQSFHVRQPGWDYFARYRRVFREVQVFDARFENPKHWSGGEVPVCYR